MEGRRIGNEKNFHNPISTSKGFHVKDMEEFSCFDCKRLIAKLIQLLITRINLSIPMAVTPSFPSGLLGDLG